MIRKTQHLQIMWVKDHSEYVSEDKIHLENHIVTTWYFLFIPIFKSKILNHA